MGQERARTRLTWRRNYPEFSDVPDESTNTKPLGRVEIRNKVVINNIKVTDLERVTKKKEADPARTRLAIRRRTGRPGRTVPEGAATCSD
jgi:hypothetical protein